MSKTSKAARAGGSGSNGASSGGKKKATTRKSSKTAAESATGKPAPRNATAAKPAAKKAKKAPAKKPAKKAAKGGAAVIAEGILADEHPPSRIAALADDLLDERDKPAASAARVLSELLGRKPELLVGYVERFAHGLTSPHRRVVQTAAEALPVIARHAPARVARQLDTLKAAYDETSDVGKDGLVRTFSNLCIASVAYQKRLEPVLTKALGTADGKVLVEWTDVVLPALKGEPHARARAVVEDRLPSLERATAQKIADYLGIKLRPVQR